MNKLEETMTQHPEMDPFAITRIEVAKLSEPVQRGALTAVVDLMELTYQRLSEGQLSLREDLCALDRSCAANGAAMIDAHAAQAKLGADHEAALKEDAARAAALKQTKPDGEHAMTLEEHAERAAEQTPAALARTSKRPPKE